MHSFSVLTHDRDYLLLLGRMLAAHSVEQEQENKRPWTFLFNGAADSGKSLVAIGADTVFRPQLYPKGDVSRTIKADLWLAPGEINPDKIPVSYKNYNYQEYFDRHSLDTALSRFHRQSPGAVMCIAANIQRTAQGAFNYAAAGNMGSRYLHAELTFGAMTENGVRKIDVIARDERLYQSLNKSGLVLPAS